MELRDAVEKAEGKLAGLMYGSVARELIRLFGISGVVLAAVALGATFGGG